ncbi:MAG: alpha-amylase family protein [Candidatus Methylacidiphilales bacterium]|nr:alpha-amylase family protein [Candidatus Methylacidiphilales bacterium]
MRIDCRSRQVHLDFHTSPLIGQIGSEFDAAEFVETFRRAHVNSVTIFARCHHGFCYYPSQVAPIHPGLRGRDLLGEMIEALHKADIRCPVYTTVGWDEESARLFPAWRMLQADGIFARCANPDPQLPTQPGGWHFLDWLHPDYQDYLEAHTRELCHLYDIDGLFYDIVMFSPMAHYGAASMNFRERHGFGAPDPGTFQRFQSAAVSSFASRFTRLLKGIAPRASVFYNSGLDVFIDGTGGRSRTQYCSHVEIESLPSGFWGYHHFPRLARSAGRWGKPWLGQTGRFQRMWGDFGGIKSQAALEYECFRSQAHGGANSVGDQLPPRGTLDSAAYRLIGEVYRQCASAESFYAGSIPIPHVGILTANHPDSNLVETGKSDEGAILMCEESHYDAALLDDQSDLDPYALIILPDSTVITTALEKKLRKYYAAGGKLILSHRSGFKPDGRPALTFLPVRPQQETPAWPTYWRTKKSFWPEMAASDRVIYSRGTNLACGRGVRVLVDRVPPYFHRTDLTFSSHFQAPPVKNPSPYPAVVSGQRFVWFADPIFREYREFGNGAARDVWRRVMRQMIGPAPVGDGLPTTMLVIPRRQRRDLILTLLHYIPTRKCLAIDIIEEASSFSGEILRVPPGITRIIDEGNGGKELDKIPGGGFILPSCKGRLLLRAPGFFPARNHNRSFA